MQTKAGRVETFAEPGFSTKAKRGILVQVKLLNINTVEAAKCDYFGTDRN
jgi:hypothetical protein